MVKGLGVFCKYRDRWSKNRGVIQCPYLKDHSARCSRRFGSDGCSAIRAEISRYRVVQVRATEAGSVSLDVAECCFWDHNENVWISAGDVLALATVTLHLSCDVAFKGVSDLTTITSTVYLHSLFPPREGYGITMLSDRQQNIVTRYNESDEGLSVKKVLVIFEDAFTFHFHPRCVAVGILG